MIYTFPIKTISELNARDSHWSQRDRRRRSQQRDFALLWRSQKIKVSLPATIIFTRYSFQTMDTDNLAGAMKHVQDQLANEIGIDDGSPLINFIYRQKQIYTREIYFTIEILES
jgi:hypothetical protein